jgi:Mg/Co/Ni transporter MgtE
MVRLRSPHDGVARLHPVEIAKIMGALSFDQGQEVLAALDDETAADTVPELDPDAAADHISALDRERAADILDEMDPDEVADILGDLPEEQAADLLARMEPDESADVRELLAYDEDSAAGLMTTDFATIPTGLTAGEALAHLRTLEEPPDPLYHVYIVPTAGSWHLEGVVSLRNLVFADPATPVADLKEEEYRTADLATDPKAVVYTMAEYNLPELPVVDEAGEICGVVLIDDAIDVLYPDLWHRRIAKGFGR